MAAMEPVTVVVPVLRRPHNAEPFMASLRSSVSGDPPPVVAVANVDDDPTAEAWRRAGAKCIRFAGQPGSYGQKANYAARWPTVAKRDWMFLVGDDVCFHPGWLDVLDDVSSTSCIVGTNDLANPRVTSGDHAVHFFLRMDYVREQGASWDGPGTVAGPYRHWFTDDEIITIAKMRGVFEPRLDSVVEHLHPYFDRGSMDDVYRIGEAHAEADQVLWLSRVERFAPELPAPRPEVVDLT